MATAGMSLPQELPVHAWAAVGALALGVYVLDLFQKYHVGILLSTDKMTSEPVEASPGNLQHRAHERDGMLMRAFPDEGVLHSGRREKTATALFYRLLWPSDQTVSAPMRSVLGE